MDRIRKILQPKIAIYSMGTYTPSQKITSSEVEERIRKESSYTGFRENSVFEISGTYTRYFSDSTEEASTLASEAAKKALSSASMKIDEIDAIIFASASQDVIEPATGNRVQTLLSSKAPVFDIKNACNSFLNGLQVAKSLISSGQYSCILVCSGETPSRAIRWETKSAADFKDAFAGYNLSDAGVAMILGKQKAKLPEIVFTEFLSKGEYFDASMIPGGGSCFPRDTEKLFFRSDSRRLSEAFNVGILDFTQNTLKKHRWKLSKVNYFLPHIVSRYSKEVFSNTFSLPHHRILNYNSTHGNMASCSVPFAFITEYEKKRFISHERILMVGLGAGASYALVGIEFP
ncbi:MAG: ketoacyl-ACP synthase III [Candidatus Altimarinota bacterium]